MGSTIRIGSGGIGGGGEQPPPPDPSVEVAPSVVADATVPLLAAPSIVADATVTMPLPAGRPRCPECGERFSRGSRFCAFDGTRLADAPPEESSDDPLVGQVVGGKYTVLRPIGEGGMGTVYEVRHTALDRRFALKALRPEIAQNAEHLQRFLLEAKAAAAIGHPSLVSVSDFGECEIRGRRVPFFVMEFLAGTSLAALLKKEKTLPPKRCARILADCAEALAAAHAAGVIHRDLKPDNIFLTGDAGDVVKVLDFGVAKMQSVTKRLTKVGMVFGTPHYMSPEQAAGKGIDHRADIYALGVILYECLAGRVPFEADTSMGVLTKQIFANPEPIERVIPDATALGALGPIVMRCLEKEPDDRFASMEELAAALHQAIVDPVASANGSLGGGSGRFKRPPLRLREEMAVPRALAPPEEPAPRQWTRIAAFAAAAVAVLALVSVSVRALVLSPGAPGSGTGDGPRETGGTGATQGATGAGGPTRGLNEEPSAAPGGTDASGGTAAPGSTAAPGGTAAGNEVAPSGSGAATAGSSGAVAGTTSTGAKTGGSGPSSATPSSSTPSSATPSSTAPHTSTGKKPPTVAVIDPWGNKPKKPPPPPAVLDPWAPRK